MKLFRERLLARPVERHAISDELDAGPLPLASVGFEGNWTSAVLEV